MNTLPGPHGYLTCQDVQGVMEKQHKALRDIMERCSGTAWNLAAAALGATFMPDEDRPDSRDRFIEKVKHERDEARADVIRMFEAVREFLAHKDGAGEEVRRLLKRNR